MVTKIDKVKIEMGSSKSMESKLMLRPVKRFWLLLDSVPGKNGKEKRQCFMFRAHLSSSKVACFFFQSVVVLKK